MGGSHDRTLSWRKKQTGSERVLQLEVNRTFQRPDLELSSTPEVELSFSPAPVIHPLKQGDMASGNSSMQHIV